MFPVSVAYCIPAHLFLFNLSTRITGICWAVEVIKVLVTPFLQAPITSSILGPNMKNCWICAYKRLTVRVKTTNACT